MESEKKRAKNKKIYMMVGAAFLAICIISTVVLVAVFRNGSADGEETAVYVESDNNKKSADEPKPVVKTQEEITEEKYQNALELLENEKFDEAMNLFVELGDYKNSPEQIFEVKYRIAEKLVKDGNLIEGALGFMEINHYKDSLKKMPKLEQRISAGANYTVGLAENGKILTAGDNSMGQRDVADWKNIVGIDASFDTMGLRADGTVVVASADEGRDDAENWSNIVAICNEEFFKVGLKSNGTVVTTGPFYAVNGWRNIADIAAGDGYVVGLTTDGRVVACGEDNSFGQCDVSGWSNIVAISAGYNHTVGLEADGTVVAVGNNETNACSVSDWEDIVAISAGALHTVGLRSDGTVVSTTDDPMYDVSGWSDIVAVSAGHFHIIGMKADGTILVTGLDDSGQCSGVQGWNLYC